MNSKKGSDGIVDYNKSDIPYSVLFNGSHIELFGNSRMTVEGKYSILEYSSQMIRVKLSKKTLIICGSNLVLGSVEIEGFLLIGNILSINFE